MKKHSKLMAILLVVAMILPGMAQAAPVANEVVPVERIAGSGRVQTAVEASKVGYAGGADAVVLAGYSGEVDALTGTLLANAKKAPVLLTRKEGLSADTKTEIERLNAKTVYILGGESVVSKKVVSDLEAMTNITVERVEGDNRYATAHEVAKEVKGKTNHVFLALGENEFLADALSVGSASAVKDMPVLLTKKDFIPQSTLDAMTALGVTDITLVGGINAISEKVEKDLKEDYTVDRVWGVNRERTAAAVANKYFPKAKNVLVAQSIPDALVGGYLGAKINAPILLTKMAMLHPETEAFIKTAETEKVWVLGGDDVISVDTFKAIEEAIKGEEVVEELKVESVSAITETNVDVTITALKEAMTDVTIDVKDNKGNVVEVKPVDLVKGETVASFTFEKSLTEKPEGTWTVAGIKVDLDLQANLKAVYNYENQVKLYEGLNKLELTDVNADNIVKYADAIDKLKDSTDEENYVSEEDFTKAAAQAVVAAGNKAAADAKDEKAVVKAVNEATNQVALLSALSSFDRVNADWIKGYKEAIDAANDPEVTLETIKEIQAEIDEVNRLAVKEKVDALKLGEDDNVSIDKTKLNEAKALVSAYQKPDGKGETAKKDTLDAIDVQLAIRGVLDAKTPAQLTVAMNSLKALDAGFALNLEDNYIDANREAYIKELKDTAAADKNTIGEINGILVKVNAEQTATPINNIDKAGKAITDLTSPVDATKQANLLKALKSNKALKNVTDANKKFYAELASARTNTVNAFAFEVDANKGGNITPLPETPTAAQIKTTNLSIQALVDKANLAAVNQDTADSNVTYNALVAYGNDIKDLSINNKAQYNDKFANKSITSDGVQTTVDKANIAALKAQKTSAAGVLAKLNIMTQVKNVKAENAVAYLASVKDTSTSGSLGHTDTDTIGEVQTAITAINKAEIAKVSFKNLNEAKTATEVNNALTTIALANTSDFTNYINLSAADKVALANVFLSDDLVETLSENPRAVKLGEYKEVSEVKAVVETLITAKMNEQVKDINELFVKPVGSLGEEVLTQQAPTNLTVQPELDKLVNFGYTTFDELSDAEKLAVTGKFIANYPTDKEGKYVANSYKSLVQVLNAVTEAAK